jgi:hypothetical protein
VDVSDNDNESEHTRELPIVKMTPEEALAAMTALRLLYDRQRAHAEADEILCSLLRFLGHDDVVEAYDDLEKWYG